MTQFQDTPEVVQGRGRLILKLFPVSKRPGPVPPTWASASPSTQRGLDEMCTPSTPRSGGPGKQQGWPGGVDSGTRGDPRQSYFGGTCLSKPQSQPAHRGSPGGPGPRPPLTGIKSDGLRSLWWRSRCSDAGEAAGVQAQPLKRQSAHHPPGSQTPHFRQGGFNSDPSRFVSLSEPET